MKILSFDPGKATGYALIESDGEISNSVVKAAGSLQGWLGIDELLRKCRPDLVVFETFRLYPWNRKSQTWSAFEPVEAIGVIKYLCSQANIPIVGQSPAMKKFFSDKKLRSLGAFLHRSSHERDALRHAFYYLAFGKKKRA